MGPDTTPTTRPAPYRYRHPTKEPMNHNQPSRPNWALYLLAILVAVIALQMCSAREEQQKQQERRDRQNSTYCLHYDNPAYCD